MFPAKQIIINENWQLVQEKKSEILQKLLFCFLTFEKVF